MEASLETAADRHGLVRSSLRLPWICQLWDLAGSEAPKQRLADAGAVEALRQAMSQHREVAAVQKNSAAALRIWPLAAGAWSSGSPTQEPCRRCSRPWPSMEEWPLCSGLLPRRCGT